MTEEHFNTCMKDLQEKVGKILDRLARLETTLDLRANFDERLRDLETGHAVCRRHPVEEFEERIKAMELKQAEMKGRATVLAAIVSAGMSIAISVIASLIIWAAKG